MRDSHSLRSAQLLGALLEPALLIGSADDRVIAANGAFAAKLGLEPAVLAGAVVELPRQHHGADERAPMLRLGDRSLPCGALRHCAPVEGGRLLLFGEPPVADRRQHDEALLGYFREALDTLLHYVAIFDREDRLIACNKYYRDTFSSGDRHLPADIELEGKTYRELMELRVRYKLHRELTDDPERFLEERMRRFYEDGDNRVRMANGRITRAQYRRLKEGGRVLVSTDITEIVEAEQKRLELEAQLHHSQKLEALGTLAGGLAHDLNNTLVPILAYSKLLARRALEGSRERAELETIRKSAERAKDLVSRILTFSRKETMGLREFDLGEVVRESLEMLRALIPSTIAIVPTLQPVPLLRGDPGQWHQVLMNLITNAAHAIGYHPGRINVELAPAGRGIRLAVSDNGAGMDEETRRRALEPFFTTRNVGEGTGLGLSVVHGIVSAHGGAIEIESAKGHGTCFRITLPAVGQRTAPVSPALEALALT